MDEGSSSMQSKYKGVRKRKWGKWVSEIRLPNNREHIWLGSYDTPEKVARAFDAASFCLRGGKAKFNFPDNPPAISGGRNLSRSEIREAVARFTNLEEDSSDGRGENEIQEESHSTMDIDSEFRSILLMIGSSNFASEFDLFPVFDDFSDEYSSDCFREQLSPIKQDNYQGEEHYDDSMILWKF